MAYTLYEKMEILTWAKEHGTIDAARKFGVASSTVVRWNREYHVYEIQEMHLCTEEKKIEILTYANNNGLTNAKNHYHISVYAMQQWNKQLKIYSHTGRKETVGTKTRYSRESVKFKITVLQYAKEHGPIAASRHFDVAESTIAVWNKKYKVYQKRRLRTFSDAQKQEILNYADKNGIPAAAREFDLAGHQIAQWKKSIISKKEL